MFFPPIISQHSIPPYLMHTLLLSLSVFLLSLCLPPFSLSSSSLSVLLLSLCLSPLSLFFLPTFSFHLSQFFLNVSLLHTFYFYCPLYTTYNAYLSISFPSFHTFLLSLLYSLSHISFLFVSLCKFLLSSHHGLAVNDFVLYINYHG